VLRLLGDCRHENNGGVGFLYVLFVSNAPVYAVWQHPKCDVRKFGTRYALDSVGVGEERGAPGVDYVHMM
jgi:hypothetical protein